MFYQDLDLKIRHVSRRGSGVTLTRIHELKNKAKTEDKPREGSNVNPLRSLSGVKDCSESLARRDLHRDGHAQYFI